MWHSTLDIHRYNLVLRTRPGIGVSASLVVGSGHDFNGVDASVAFPGGLFELGPLRRDVAGVVVRLEDRVLRITPPATVTCTCDGRWC
jgi:hypothetical protein